MNRRKTINIMLVLSVVATGIAIAFLLPRQKEINANSLTPRDTAPRDLENPIQATLARTQGEPSGRFNNLMNRVRQAHGQDAVIVLLENYLAEFPQDPNAQTAKLQLAYAYAKKGRADKAREILTAMIDSVPADSSDFYVLQVAFARVDSIAQDWDASNPKLRAVIDRVLDQEPKEYLRADPAFSAYMMLAENYEQQGKVDDALDVLVEAAERALRLAKQSGEPALFRQAAISALWRRINMVRASDPMNLARGEDLFEELKSKFDSSELGFIRESSQHLFANWRAFIEKEKAGPDARRRAPGQGGGDL